MSLTQSLPNDSQAKTSTCLEPKKFHKAISKAPVLEPGSIPSKYSLGKFNSDFVSSIHIFNFFFQ